MRHRDAAICLRTVDYSETSQVVTFLTRTRGVVRLIAKGSKRAKSKTGGALDLLAEGDLVYTTGRGEGLGALVEFSETVSHAPLRRDARRLNAALYALELASMTLAEEDPHPEVFDLLHNSLRRLGEPDAPVPAVVAYFQWRLLHRVGLLGELDACASCGEPIASGARDVHFSSRAGGLLCASCEGAYAEKRRVGRDALAGLAALAAARAGRRARLEPAQAHAVNRLLAYHLTEQLGRRPRMARHVLRGKT
jgi:DNA repair protein RecO (recombination protein O)